MASGIPRHNPEAYGDEDELAARVEAAADDSQAYQAMDEFFGVTFPPGAPSPAPNTGYTGNELVPLLRAGRVVSGTGVAPSFVGTGSEQPADGSSAPVQYAHGDQAGADARTTGRHGSSHT